jgi:hypothetical protein
MTEEQREKDMELANRNNEEVIFEDIGVEIEEQIGGNEFNKQNYPNLFAEQEQKGLIGIFSPWN